MQRQNEGHLSPFPIWDDVRTFNGSPWRGIVDVVSCGFPCQAFSRAATRGRKSKNLWPPAFKIIDDVQPELIFIENVSEKAVFNAGKDLARIGYRSVYTKASAADVGADHLRERYWLLAYTDHESELLQSIHAKKTSVSKLQTRIWESNPFKHGVPDGLANRMDRNRAIGNGQVPAVVQLAWYTLTKAVFEESE
jgi:DNA (cytosine-5)-methyltransferase 1